MFESIDGMGEWASSSSDSLEEERLPLVILETEKTYGTRIGTVLRFGKRRRWLCEWSKDELRCLISAKKSK